MGVCSVLRYLSVTVVTLYLVRHDLYMIIKVHSYVKVLLLSPKYFVVNIACLFFNKIQFSNSNERSKDDTTGSIPPPSIKFTGTHLCTWL